MSYACMSCDVQRDVIYAILGFSLEVYGCDGLVVLVVILFKKKISEEFLGKIGQFVHWYLTIIIIISDGRPISSSRLLDIGLPNCFHIN